MWRSEDATIGMRSEDKWSYHRGEVGPTSTSRKDHTVQTSAKMVLRSAKEMPRGLIKMILKTDKSLEV